MQPSDWTARISSARGRLPSVKAPQIGELILKGIDGAVENSWESAKHRAKHLEGDSIEDQVRAVTRIFARELATIGAATGAMAAIPVAGTGAAVTAGVAEIGWFTRRMADMILTIAAIHAIEEPTLEERRSWILVILLAGPTAEKTFAKLAGETGKGLGKKATGRISTDALKKINSTMGRTIITKYGTKRGVVALGRVLPFGIGAAIGGTTNYVSVRTVARHADNFFAKLPARVDPEHGIDWVFGS